MKLENLTKEDLIAQIEQYRLDINKFKSDIQQLEFENRTAHNSIVSNKKQLEAEQNRNKLFEKIIYHLIGNCHHDEGGF